MVQMDGFLICISHLSINEYRGKIGFSLKMVSVEEMVLGAGRKSIKPNQIKIDLNQQYLPLGQNGLTE